MKSSSRSLSSSLASRFQVLTGIVLVWSLSHGMAMALMLPKIFGDHMVLQRGIADPVWGLGTPGEKVTVSFGGQEVSGTAGIDGTWIVKLAPMKDSSEGRTMTVAAVSGTASYTDVLVGEVWVCGGQSNMAKPLGPHKGQKPVDNTDAVLKAADNPILRLFQINTQAGKSRTPQKDLALPASWVACSGTTLMTTQFSAVGYFFAKDLQARLGVPVGIIHSSWGGTRIEPWIPAEGWAGLASLSGFADAAKVPGGQFDKTPVGNLYDGMIAPIVPFGIKGVIWYQGESNVMNEDGPLYTDKMQALIQGWRKDWNEGDFAFYWVQLAPFRYTSRLKDAKPHSVESLPLGWEAQTRALKIPHTGMAVITDLVTDLKDIHPTNKAPVGDRLVRIALAKDYGMTDVVYSGPMYRDLKINGAEAVVSFDDADGGLNTRDGQPPNWFTIAGEDQHFVDATAKIDGDTVVVSSPAVAQPAAVRFGWNEDAMPNLMNKAGLPASPFRTDAWPIAQPTPYPSPVPLLSGTDVTTGTAGMTPGVK
jgi:sialate O-acetylesterase